MRLHRLEITAFGPFAGTEEIDFEELTSAGLFLIHGPTGAGKTSVLDAVCFALYGRVPGVRQAARNLRSDHAPAGRAPAVTLEATIRGRRLRISRSPAWQRPKRRGDGVTTEQARVSVEERDGSTWIVRSARNDEAGHFITGLLDMSAEQFCQVVLLPQGEFATFLRTGAEERRAVLQRLFAAELFANVEKWLAERRASSGRETTALRLRAESVADRIAEVAGTIRPDDVLAGWASELAVHLADIGESATRQADAAAARLDHARHLAEQGRVLADRQRRHAAAAERQSALDERAGERARAEAVLAAAARADRVIPLVRAVAERATAVERAGALAKRARASLAGLASETASLEVLGKEERTRRDEAAGLEQLRTDAARLRSVRQEIGVAERELADLGPRADELENKLHLLPERVTGLRQELEAARSRAAARPAAEVRLESAWAQLTAAQNRDELADTLMIAEERHRVMVDDAQEARERLQEIRQARLDGMAVLLAQDLRPGSPCTVCGSADHPAPAAQAGDVPLESDEHEAQADFDRAQQAREESAGRVAGLGAELAAETKAAGGADARSLEEDRDIAEAAVAGLAGAERDVGRLTADVQVAEAETARVRDESDEVMRTRSATRTRRDELMAEAGRLTGRLDKACGDDVSVETRIDRLLREADVIRAAALAVDREATCVAEHTAACLSARATALEEDFASAEDAAAAAIPSDVAGELRASVRANDDEDASVRELLGDTEVASAAGQPVPDLEMLEAELAEADATSARVVAARDRARHRHERILELRDELAARVAEWRPAAARHEVATRLAELAVGTSADNQLRMRLSAYVLAARLEQVVAAANERLARMAAGRYTLLHTVERAAGDRRVGSGGLGLRVADAWTGQERDPATLSGGETFLCSLALALGLADVVTAEAGGAEIGTLFVDEGFGTLDEETLDEVMDVLDGLRDGGRAVGIVSHVAELRTRVPAQLRVRKNRTGSQLTVTR